MNATEAIKQANANKNTALAQLHTELGYGSASDLADAILRATAIPGAFANGGKAGQHVALVVAPGHSRKGRRIPDEKRKQIAAALKAGETGYHLAAKFGVSYNIIHAIKHELGM